MRKTLLVFLILLLTSSAVFAKLEEEKKLEKVQEELELHKQKLLETKKKEAETLGNLFVISKELKQTKRDLNRAKTKIAINDSSINVLLQEIRKSGEEMRGKTKLLEDRLTEIYKSSSANYLELLFASKSMSDFINRSYYFGKVINTDATLVKEITELWEGTKKKKSTLEQVNTEIKELAGQIEEKKETITQKAKEEKDTYEQLQARRKEYEEKVAQLEKDSFELERVIAQKVAERIRSRRTFRGGSGTISWPLQGRITSVFGYRRHPYWGGRRLHTGLDIAARYGTPVGAADSGEVIFSGWWGGYGKAVVIDHGQGITTVYGHMSRIYAQNGATIEKGQIIGLIGSTGFSTGPHLHFEVRKNGKPTNPMSWLP